MTQHVEFQGRVKTEATQSLRLPEIRPLSKENTAHTVMHILDAVHIPC